MAVTIRHVAAAASVSIGTVSNVLNRPELVSAGVRARVQDAMPELGFVPNGTARHLRIGRGEMLAYIVSDMANPFFTDIAKGVDESIGKDLSLFVCDSDGDPARELVQLTRLERHRVLGVLITPTDPDSPAFTELPRRGIPMVLVDRAPAAPTHCSVAVDDVLGGELATKHLLAAGHERIAFIGGPTSLGQVQDRWRGARAALTATGQPVDRLVQIGTAAPTVPEGRAAAERLWALPRRSQPTAAFCANDLLALGVLQKAVEIGVRVPDDLAIVGYDDIDHTAAAAVPLTSVRQPRRALWAARRPHCCWPRSAFRTTATSSASSLRSS